MEFVIKVSGRTSLDISLSTYIRISLGRRSDNYTASQLVAFFNLVALTLVSVHHAMQVDAARLI